MKGVLSSGRMTSDEHSRSLATMMSPLTAGSRIPRAHEILPDGSITSRSSTSSTIGSVCANNEIVGRGAASHSRTSALPTFVSLLGHSEWLLCSSRENR